jgi:hypothetical protein
MFITITDYCFSCYFRGGLFLQFFSETVRVGVKSVKTKEQNFVILALSKVIQIKVSNIYHRIFKEEKHECVIFGGHL